MPPRRLSAVEVYRLRAKEAQEAAAAEATSRTQEEEKVESPQKKRKDTKKKAQAKEVGGKRKRSAASESKRVVKKKASAEPEPAAPLAKTSKRRSKKAEKPSKAPKEIEEEVPNFDSSSDEEKAAGSESEEKDVLELEREEGEGEDGASIVDEVDDGSDSDLVESSEGEVEEDDEESEMESVDSISESEEETAVTSTEAENTDRYLDLGSFRVDPAKVAEHDNGCLIRLETNESICVEGSSIMTVISGAVEVAGSTIHAGSRQSVCFPPGFTLSTISAVKTSISKGAFAVGPDLQHLAAVKLKGRAPAAVLLFHSNPYGPGPLPRNMERNVFSASSFHILPPEGSRGCVPLSISSDWESVVEDCVKSSTSGSRASYFTVIGGKNAGKSTFCGFLTNKLLNRHKAVAYVDTDLGQPQFCAPGMVSVTIVDTPVIGPPYTSIREPLLSYFVGDVSPKCDPELYTKSIEKLLDGLQSSEYSSIPVVVNTNGWNKGYGAVMLSQLLSKIARGRVIEFENKDADSAVATSLPVTRIPPTVSTYTKSSITAAHKRTLQLLSYFCPTHIRLQNLANYLSSQTPLVLPWAGLSIRITEQIPAEQALVCLNGSLVALCKDTAQEDSQIPLDLGFSLSSASTPIECVGYALIRSVDVTARCFYVLTPAARERLKDVNVVVKGALEAPTVMTFTGGKDEPYIMSDSVGGLGSGSGIMKSRTNLLRRKHN